jgi:hypothetical protein
MKYITEVITWKLNSNGSIKEFVQMSKYHFKKNIECYTNIYSQEQIYELNTGFGPRNGIHIQFNYKNAHLK